MQLHTMILFPPCGTVCTTQSSCSCAPAFLLIHTRPLVRNNSNLLSSLQIMRDQLSVVQFLWFCADVRRRTRCSAVRRGFRVATRPNNPPSRRRLLTVEMEMFAPLACKNSDLAKSAVNHRLESDIQISWRLSFMEVMRGLPRILCFCISSFPLPSRYVGNCFLATANTFSYLPLTVTFFPQRDNFTAIFR